MDYTIFYKKALEESQIEKIPQYDIFLSAFDDCNRTKVIFEKISALRKQWFIFPQYRDIKEFPQTDAYKNNSLSESEYFSDFMSDFLEQNNYEKSLCIDITGFIRPHLIFLLKFLSCSGSKKVDLLYSEPVLYKNADETKFSGFIDEIKDIEGCSAVTKNKNDSDDLLIICAGYDDNLMARIAQDKNNCKKKYYIQGFPSLQPDMYQESVLKMENAKESIGESKEIRFAPAFDPFVTAQVINDIIEENPKATNIFLSPLSTKPQTVGMALFYIINYEKLPLSITFPYSNKYTSKHAEGIKRTWMYTLEF